MNKLIMAAIRCSLIFLLPTGVYAISAQWDLDPISGDWNTAANWTPNGVPNGPADIATFGLSNTTFISLSADTEVNSIIFTSAATSSYTITKNSGFTLTISGTGIVNNSGITQNFVTNGSPFGGAGQISFTNNATAGSSTIFTNNHGTTGFEGGRTSFFNTSTAGTATFVNASDANFDFIPGQGVTRFFDSSTAGNGIFINKGVATIGLGNGGSTGFGDTSSAGEATITNNGGVVFDAGGGNTFFGDSSTAASANITNNAGMVSGARGGGMFFAGNATAANAVVINNGGVVSGAFGGGMVFSGNSTAGNSTLIANGGVNGGLGGIIRFINDSTGGTAQIEIFGNGSLEIDQHTHTGFGVTIGSIEGDGNVLLGVNRLNVGSNNLSTEFSGEIQGTGLLTKIGTGTLTLSGANTYIGNTNIRRGVLQVDGSITSDTFVYSGSRLAGTGTIYGNISNNGAGRVSPGALGVPGELAVVHNYTQAQYATLMIQIAGANAGQFSVLNVLGAANLNGNLAPVLLNGFVPDIGQSFTFLNYASFTGAFSQIQHQVFNHGTLQWSVIYQNTNAILTVEPHTPGVPDQGSTLLLLTLGLLGLVTFRRQLLRGQS